MRSREQPGASRELERWVRKAGVRRTESEYPDTSVQGSRLCVRWTASALNRQDRRVAGLDDLLRDATEDDPCGSAPGAGTHDCEIGPQFFGVLRDDREGLPNSTATVTSTSSGACSSMNCSAVAVCSRLWRSSFSSLRPATPGPLEGSTTDRTCLVALYCSAWLNARDAASVVASLPSVGGRVVSYSSGFVGRLTRESFFGTRGRITVCGR